MGLETGTYVADLVETNPALDDFVRQADDHLRLIKSCLKATFPNATGPFPEAGNIATLDAVTNAFTGNATFAGDVTATILTSNRPLPRLDLVSTDNTSDQRVSFNSTDGNEARIFQDQSASNLRIVKYTADNTFTAAEIQIEENGNIEFFTGGVDGNSADSHLVLAGAAGSQTAIFLGDVTLGTDASSTGLLVKGGTGDLASIQLDGGTNGTDNSSIQSKYSLILKADSGEAIGGRIIRFDVGANTALTLDSSQDATFAGAVTASEQYNARKSNVSIDPAILNLEKDRAGAAVQVGDRIGHILFNGYDGSAYVGGATIRAEVDDTVALGEVPVSLNFFTENRAGTGQQLALALDSQQEATFFANLNMPDVSNIQWGTGNERIRGNGSAFQFYTDNSLALTLDASQEAIFAGDISMSDTSPIINVGSTSLGTGIAGVQIGVNRTGDGPSRLRMMSDGVTYTSGAFEIDRAAGANGNTLIRHRGTGNFDIVANELAQMTLQTNNTTAVQIGSDQLVTFPVAVLLKEIRETAVNLSGTSPDVNLTSGSVFRHTVATATNTFTFSNPSTCTAFTLILVNGGSQTVNWPGSVVWAGGGNPTLTAAGTDVLTFVTDDGGTTWYGAVGGLNYS